MGRDSGVGETRLNMILKKYCHLNRKEGDGNESTGEKEARNT